MGILRAVPETIHSIVFFILVATFLFHATSLGHDTGATKEGEIQKGNPVHQYITEEAGKVWRDLPPEMQSYLRKSSITTPVHRLCEARYEPGYDIVAASADEDQEWWISCNGPRGPYFASRYNNGFFEHFWDPDEPNFGGVASYDKGLSDVAEPLGILKGKQFASAYRKAQELWDRKAICYYTGRDRDSKTCPVDKAQAYYWLGRVAHLLEDLAVPAHVHNVQHDPYANLPLVGLGGKDPFEDYAGSIFSTFHGRTYQGNEYRYEDLPGIALQQGFQWTDVHPNPTNLFKLFWYTAQRTQYYATGGTILARHGDGGKYRKLDGMAAQFRPSLWQIEGIQPVETPTEVATKLREMADALIPHALRAVAGLYRLFWDETHPPEESFVGKDGAPMVLVPAGEFTMGSDASEIDTALQISPVVNPDVYRGTIEWEIPRHQVFLDAFYIDKYEITNALYRKFVQETGRKPPIAWRSGLENLSSPNQPVAGVAWDDAESYCRWAGKRLPTEAEWEKAARGTDGRMFPWGNTWDKSRANTRDGGPSKTTPVGSYEGGKSPYGAYDMAGNVQEWVSDWWDERYYQRTSARSPSGPDVGEEKVTRGGAFPFPPIEARTSHRSPSGNSLAGFRCAKTLLLAEQFEAGRDYFPLKEGKTWTYQLSGGSLFGGGNLKVIITNLAQRELKGRKVTPQHARGEQGQSEFVFIGHDADGVYEFATQKSGDVEPNLKNSPHYLIGFPVDIGKQWNTTYETSFLAEKVSVPLKCFIESKNEEVTVPAGNFKSMKTKCVGSATKKVGLGIMASEAQIRLENHSWYSTGVGVIRQIRIEESNHLMLGGGRATLELLSHK